MEERWRIAGGSLEDLIREKVRSSRYSIKPLSRGKHDIRQLDPYELNYAFEMVAYKVAKLKGYNVEI